MIRIIKETTFKDNPYGIKGAEIKDEHVDGIIVRSLESKINNCQFSKCIIDLLKVDIKDCTFRNCWFINLNNIKFFESSLYSCTVHLFKLGVNSHCYSNVEFYSTDINNVVFTSNEFVSKNIIPNIGFDDNKYLENQDLISHF